MKNNRIPAAILVVFLLCIIAHAQDSHVRTEYMKDVKMTKVETDLIYVINDPTQFMQLSLTSRYKGEKLAKAPDKVNLSIWSTSKKALYRSNKDRKLIVVTDGEEWTAGDLGHLVMIGETKNGKDVFYSENRPGLGMEIGVPPSAQVRTDNSLNGLFAEWLLIDLKLEQFLKIAAARKLEFRLGKTSFNFTDNQMETIREFASKIKL